MPRLIDPRVSRREVIRVTTGLGGMAALQGMGTVVQSVMQPALAQSLGLSSLRATAKSWIWGAEDFGIGAKHFEKAGLKVSIASTERGSNHDALLGGAADILLGAPQQNMRVQILGKPCVMIAGFVNKFASNVVVKKEIAEKHGVTEASDPLKKAAVLKGLKLGTTGPGGGPDQLLRYFLRMAGLDPNKDAQLVPVRGGPANIAAMQQGQIDGFCLSSPTSDVAVEKAGAVYLFNMANNPPPEMVDFLYITTAITKDTGQKKANELVAYCKGLGEALKAIHADPNTFKEWARGWFADMDPQLFETSFKNNINIYMKSPVPTKHHFDSSVKFMNETLKEAGQQPAPATYSYEEAFDLSFVKKALG